MASVPPLLLVGTAIICLGDLLHVIGLGTPSWLENESVDKTSGLFKTCTNGVCVSFIHTFCYLEVVQAMTIIGMLFGLVAGATAIVYVVLSLLSKSTPKFMILICTASCVAAFIFILIGVIVYGSKIFDDFGGQVKLSYSFGLCITGAILLVIGGALVLIGGKSIL